MDEISEITEHIQEAAGSSADVIWGYCKDDSLGEKVRITIIATGFPTHPITGAITTDHNTRTVIPLDADRPTMITRPIVNPVEANATVVDQERLDTFRTSKEIEEPYLKQVEPAKESTPVAQSKIEFIIERSPVHSSKSVEAKEEQTPEVEKKKHNLYEETSKDGSFTEAQVSRTDVQEARLSPNEHQQRVEQRVAQVRDMNMRIRTTTGLNEQEREPAYKRKNIQLTKDKTSVESNVSRYAHNEEIDENGERRVELKKKTITCTITSIDRSLQEPAHHKWD